MYCIFLPFLKLNKATGQIKAKTKIVLFVYLFEFSYFDWEEFEIIHDSSHVRHNL